MRSQIAYIHTLHDRVRHRTTYAYHTSSTGCTNPTVLTWSNDLSDLDERIAGWTDNRWMHAYSASSMRVEARR